MISISRRSKEQRRQIMPEGPEARIIAEALRKKIKGRKLLWVELLRLNQPTRSGEPCGTHKEFNAKWPLIKTIFPSTCLDVITRGKQIYFFFENGVVFNSGLGLEGHWYIDQIGPYTDFCLVFGSTIETPQIMLQSEEVKIYYDDKIRYGNLVISDWAQAIQKMMSEYGPDLLNVKHLQMDIHPSIRAALPSEFFQIPTVDKFWSQMSISRRSRMTLSVFLLLHQEYFSGVGNWIFNEVCYFARIHPERVLGSITRAEAENIFQVTVHIIAVGYESNGLTHQSFLDPYQQTGRYQTAVYRKQVDPYGNPVSQIKLSCNRKGYIVESLQI